MYNVGSLLRCQFDSFFVNHEDIKKFKCEKGDLFLVIRSDNYFVFITHQNTLYSSYWTVSTLDSYFKAEI
jgi:hypothetical protein